MSGDNLRSIQKSVNLEINKFEQLVAFEIRNILVKYTEEYNIDIQTIEIEGIKETGKSETINYYVSVKASL